MSPRNKPRPVRKTIDAGVRIRSTPVVLTQDVARALIEGAAFISLAPQCPCRAERKCVNYPATFGCLFLGEGARGIVARGNGVEIDRQEAARHLLRAAGLGLVPMVLWTSDELRALGADASRALELCSCCPCCCISRRTGDGMKAYVDGITGLGLARAEGDCNACGECERACPLGAITIFDDGPVVNPDRCKGCGRCARVCKQGVLQVYPLEMVPSFTDDWHMIPARDFVNEILMTIK
jgi:ferredoxin